MSEPERYVRTRDGRVVHRADCPVVARIRQPREWTWATGMSVPQIRMRALRMNLLLDFHKCCESEAAGASDSAKTGRGQ